MPDLQPSAARTVRERLEDYAAAVSKKYVSLESRFSHGRVGHLSDGLVKHADGLTEEIASAAGIDFTEYQSLRSDYEARRRVAKMKGGYEDLPLMQPWTAMVLHERKSQELADAKAEEKVALHRIETSPKHEEDRVRIVSRIEEIDAAAKPGMKSAIDSGYASGDGRMGILARTFHATRAAVSGYGGLLAERAALAGKLVALDEDIASIRDIAVRSRAWHEASSSYSGKTYRLGKEVEKIGEVAAPAIAVRDRMLSEKWNTPSDCASWRNSMLDSEVRRDSEVTKEIESRVRSTLSRIVVLAWKATAETAPSLVRLLEPMLGEEAEKFVSQSMRDSSDDRRVAEKLKNDPLASDRLDVVRKLRILLDEGSSSDRETKCGLLLDRLVVAEDSMAMHRIGREAEDEPMVLQMSMVR